MAQESACGSFPGFMRFCESVKRNVVARSNDVPQAIAKHSQPFNSAPTTTSFTHRHTGIRQCERNEDILTSGFEVNN